jgi:hypothetical protein
MSLLVRADFVLGHSQPGDRRAYKRWRGILRDVLPRLLGCERRSAHAEKVRLRSVEDHPLFSGWVRIPIERRPGKKGLRKLAERLCNRLERSLLLVDGRVVKIGIRRCRIRDAACANPAVTPAEAAPVLSAPAPVEEQVSLPLLAGPDQPPAAVVEQAASAVPAA